MLAGVAGCSDEIFNTVGEEELSPPLAAGDLASSQSTELPSGFVPVERIALGSSGSPRSVTIDSLTNGATVSFAVCAFKDGEDTTCPATTRPPGSTSTTSRPARCRPI